MSRNINKTVKDSFKSSFDFWSTADERLALQLIDRILDDLKEGDQQPPRLRANDDDALEQNADNDLLDLDLLFVLAVRVQSQKRHREEVSVAVGEAELVRAGVDDDGAKFVVVGLRDEEMEDLHRGCINNRPVSS